MFLLKSTFRTQGGSVVARVPSEIMRRLAAAPGDTFYWIYDGSGEIRVSLLYEPTLRVLSEHERILRSYRELIRAVGR